MSERITQKTLQAAVARYQRALGLAGLGRCSELQLHLGSKTNRVSYSLYYLTPERTIKYALGTNSGFIGWTLREATDTVLTMARAFEDMAFYATEEEN